MSLIEKILIAVAIGVLLFLYVQQSQHVHHAIQEENGKMYEIHDRMNMMDERLATTEAALADEEPAKADDANKEVKEDPKEEEHIPDAYDTMGLAPVDM